MNFSISAQAAEFLSAGILGVLFGVLYEIVHLIRAGHKKFFSHLIDVGFSVIACLLLLWFVLTVANGEMRWYILVGIVIGWMLYAATIGQTVSRILQVLGHILQRVLAMTAKPFTWFCRMCYHLLLRFRKQVLSVRHRKEKTEPNQSSAIE